jgi:hypothetical protein
VSSPGITPWVHPEADDTITSYPEKSTTHRQRQQGQQRAVWHPPEGLPLQERRPDRPLSQVWRQEFPPAVEQEEVGVFICPRKLEKDLLPTPDVVNPGVDNRNPFATSEAALPLQ